MLGKQWVDKSCFRNCNINLAQPTASNVFEPDSPIFTKERFLVEFSHKKVEFKLDFTGDLTLAQFDEICEKTKIEKSPSVLIKEPSVDQVVALANALISDQNEQSRIMQFLLDTFPEGTVEGGKIQLTGHKPYPCYNTSTTFLTWDKLTINQGNLTVSEFRELFAKNFWGLKCTMLCAFKKKPKKGGSSFLYNEQSPFAPQIAMCEANLGKATSGSQKRVFGMQLKQKQKQHEDWMAKNLGGNLLDKYKQVYGDDLPPGRNYIKLIGSFVDKDGYIADIPLIKYTFQ